MSLNGYNKMVIPSDSGPELVLEINWDDNPETKKKVKINGNTIIDLKHLYGFIMTVADPETQVELMPIQTKKIDVQSTTHVIELKKDLKAGELIRVPCIKQIQNDIKK